MAKMIDVAKLKFYGANTLQEGVYLYDAALGIVWSNKRDEWIYGTKAFSDVRWFKFVDKHGRTVSVSSEELQAASCKLLQLITCGRKSPRRKKPRHQPLVKAS